MKINWGAILTISGIIVGIGTLALYHHRKEVIAMATILGYIEQADVERLREYYGIGV